ncbi:MAG: cytochrome c biogenesis protein ResB, partial [Syntrophomonas sp.]|nr:cytochrome c biogenesis protein ResB [Syntrophomonas sp.]
EQNQRGWLKNAGVLLLHLGIVIILAGGVINSYYGLNGLITIYRGNPADVSEGITIEKHFLIQLNDFTIKLNPDGSPSQYYSDITVIEDGKPQANQIISVNHPLQYKDIKFYQQGFGYLIKVNYINESSNEIENLLVPGDSLEIPGINRTLKTYFNAAEGLNQASIKLNNSPIIYNVYENDKLRGKGTAKFHEKIEFSDNSYIVFTGIEPYTILKIKHDPGLPLVFTGGLMFVIGIALALYSPTVKINSKLIISGQEVQRCH